MFQEKKRVPGRVPPVISDTDVLQFSQYITVPPHHRLPEMVGGTGLEPATPNV